MFHVINQPYIQVVNHSCRCSMIRALTGHRTWPRTMRIGGLYLIHVGQMKSWTLWGKTLCGAFFSEMCMTNNWPHRSFFRLGWRQTFLDRESADSLAKVAPVDAPNILDTLKEYDFRSDHFSRKAPLLHYDPNRTQAENFWVRRNRTLSDKGCVHLPLGQSACLHAMIVQISGYR